MPSAEPATPRDRFIAALERRPLTGRVPTFELVFYLTMEAFGRVHPLHRHFAQWGQMSETERRLQRADMADLYVATAERYEHSAIFLHNPVPGDDEMLRLIDAVREKTGDRYFLTMHGDATYAMPGGADMVEQTMWFYERPGEAKDEAARRVDRAVAAAERYAAHGGLDGFTLCADYCYNSGPFLAPDLFGELVTPYLARLAAGLRDLGFYVIKHTDGDIMPILDQLVSTAPHALHSIDPQAGVDIAEVKALVGDRVCLIGNVNCGLLQSGTDHDVVESAHYALRHGMPGGGYIFSTSNCVYTGLPLERYDLMLQVWREEGNYPG